MISQFLNCPLVKRLCILKYLPANRFSFGGEVAIEEKFVAGDSPRNGQDQYDKDENCYNRFQCVIHSDTILSEIFYLSSPQPEDMLFWQRLNHFYNLPMSVYQFLNVAMKPRVFCLDETQFGFLIKTGLRLYCNLISGKVFRKVYWLMNLVNTKFNQSIFLYSLGRTA